MTELDPIRLLRAYSVFLDVLVAEEKRHASCVPPFLSEDARSFGVRVVVLLDEKSNLNKKFIESRLKKEYRVFLELVKELDKASPDASMPILAVLNSRGVIA